MPRRKADLQKLEALDELIRNGQGKIAQAEIRLIAARNVPREQAATVAWLAWRAHLPEVGARVLNSIVRPKPDSPLASTDVERAEYAQCLTRLGAYPEASQVLKSVDKNRAPRAYHYDGALLVAQWEYGRAIPVFAAYAKATKPKSYPNLIARVNLAAALVQQRHSLKARVLLSELVHETSVRKLRLLHGNVLELSALNFILHRKWEEAEAFLKRAEDFLADTESIDAFLVRKWRGVLSILRNPRAHQALNAARREAVELGHWESVRECDRFAAIARRDRKLLQRLLAGTPYDTYRKTLEQEWGGPLSPPRFYDWTLGTSPGRTVIVEVERGSGGRNREVLRPGFSVHRLLVALTNDFYRPTRIAQLFHAMFPTEFYNPDTSPGRVHQAMKLLRRWLSANAIPAEITVEGNEFRLTAKKCCVFRVTRNPAKAEEGKYGFFLAELRGQYSDRPFALEEASRLLEKSARTTNRILGEGLASGALVREGSRAFTRYRFQS